MRKICAFVLSLAIISIFLLSCENQKKRNCYGEYQKISEWDYSHPLSAISEIQSYLIYFNKGTCGYVDEVEKIEKEFEEMKAFLEKQRTLKQWCKDSQNAPFSKSAYLSVRSTWDSCKKKADENYFSAAQDRIDKNSFRDDLKDYAIDVCKERWSGGLLSEWYVTSYEENELGQASKLDGLYGKKCSGIYTIHMEKGLLGIKKGSAKVKVEGKLVYTVDGSLFFKRIGFEVIQTNGKLD